MSSGMRLAVCVCAAQDPSPVPEPGSGSTPMLGPPLIPVLIGVFTPAAPPLLCGFESIGFGPIVRLGKPSPLALQPKSDTNETMHSVARDEMAHDIGTPRCWCDQSSMCVWGFNQAPVNKPR